MDNSEMWGYGILGLIVSYALIYFAIHNATADQRRYQRIQIKLLEEMARKAGVTEQEIEEAKRA